CQQFNTYPWTY
nr:immunoglobulin light chain junction region [Macaca mulatta]